MTICVLVSWCYGHLLASYDPQDYDERYAPSRRGLGTPATRADIIERLMKSGFVLRKGRQLIPADKGVTLIAVLPDILKSPALTADWEEKLSLVERGEMNPDAFMEDITAMIQDIIQTYNKPDPSHLALFPGDGKTKSEALGNCPRCGLAVRESAKGFFCDGRDCGFKLWKDSKFWAAKKKTLTAAVVKALLRDGRAAMKGLHSDKTGKTYDAVVLLDDTGTYVNYKLEFVR